MMRKIAALLGWALLMFIGYATLSPLGLRPDREGAAVLQYLGAYAAIGGLFSFAYPRHRWLVTVLVLGSALAFEAAQMLTPDRHARITDAATKMLGGILGTAVGIIVNRLSRR